MISRALWTGLLTLLAWIPFQQAGSHTSGSDRSLYAVSALDVASNSPARVGQRTDLPRELTADRRPPTPRVVPPHDNETDVLLPSRRPQWRPAQTLRPSGWRGFQEARLILPHDATAPPPRS
ncbi:MAG TPA: hypothetical protein VJN70_21355 [Gemmatimonadaceae bacterium]|nr:hypothetical protein [Gemmatimonadaceae bacterium]